MGLIKIGISGAHSTGKSTFIKKLTAELDKKAVRYKVVSDLAVQCPLPILKDHTVESSLWIASRNISEEIEAEHKFDVIIADRPILDSWAYFYAVCKEKYDAENPKLKTFKTMIENWLPTYNLLYQTVINENISIEDNKGRDLDEAYRKLVGDEMITASILFNTPFLPLTIENSNEQMEAILNQIDFVIAKYQILFS